MDGERKREKERVRTKSRNNTLERETATSGGDGKRNYVLSLTCMDEIGELERIADGEDREVHSNHIVVAFLGVELDSIDHQRGSEQVIVREWGNLRRSQRE